MLVGHEYSFIAQATEECKRSVNSAGFQFDSERLVAEGQSGCARVSGGGHPRVEDGGEAGSGD
jgi:hypothetical protein